MPTHTSTELEEAVRTMPLRKNATGVSPHPPKKDLLQWLNLVPLVAQGSAPSELVPVEDQNAETQSSKSETSTPRSTPSLLPLPAPQPPAAPEKMLPATDGSKKKSVAEVLTDMKLAYQRSKSQTKPVLEDKQVKEVEISQERRQPLPSLSGPSRRQGKRERLANVLQLMLNPWQSKKLLLSKVNPKSFRQRRSSRGRPSRRPSRPMESH